MLDVAGVRVDPRHWIGGERVASADAFDDLSPIDGSVLGQVAQRFQFLMKSLLH